MGTRTSTELRRRALLGAAAAFFAAAAGVAGAKAGIPLEVWKDPSCGCCKEWVAHMQASGFAVRVHESGNNGVRAQLGIDRKYGSCHTAVVGGYAIEGHVPAQDVHRLLKERPKARGLAAPGMPVGSPGMDGGVYRGRKDTYEVLLLAHDGSASVYRRYEGNKEGRKS
jgi:hypothetical protein